MRKTLVLSVMLVAALTFLVSCKTKQDIEADKAAVRELGLPPIRWTLS
jgi:hypothetical protein